MQDLYIEPSEYIPEVSFSSKENTLKIIFQKGQLHEYIPDFFQPIIDWIFEYFENSSVEKISVLIYSDQQTFEILKLELKELANHPKINFKNINT